MISDWSVGEIPGILLDDVTVTRGTTVETTSFEGVTGATRRNDLMRRSMQYLLR